MSSNTFGKLFRVTSYGESHGVAIGCVVDGCPPRLELTTEYIQQYLDLRRPGTTRMVSQRRELDQVQILSGVFAQQTTGTPIALQVINFDQKAKDYAEINSKFRPGHGDITYQGKYGVRDYRGGGRASARETVARVAAGAIARKYLAEKLGVEFCAYVKQIGDIKVTGVQNSELTPQLVYSSQCYFPDSSKHFMLEQLFTELRRTGDSIGSLVELVIRGVPLGLGEPVFAKLDAELAAAMMGINAVKAVEIGDGFACVTAKGSEFRDEILPEPTFSQTKLINAQAMPTMPIKFCTNHAGGILAGISTGQDIVVSVGFKPPSSIRVPANTVDDEYNATEITVTGRHDVCVGIRAVPIVEAMAALVIMDHVLRNRAQCGG